MTAAEFWEAAPDTLRVRIAARCNPAPAIVEIFQPFVFLPNRLKAAIYESQEFRRA